MTRDLVKSSFGLNIIIMKIYGLYPFENLPRSIFYFQAYLFYFIFTCPTPILAAVQLIVNKETNMSKICDSAFLISQIGILIVKLLPFKLNIDEVITTMNAINAKIFNKELDDQQFYLDEAVVIVRRNCKIFLTSCVLTLLSWGMKPFWVPKRIFPIDVWLPYDAFSNTWVYYTTYLVMFVGVSNAALDNAAVDTLIPGLIYHAAAQIKILKNTLQHLEKRVDKQILSQTDLGLEEKQQQKAFIMYKTICECAEHHCAIYSFVKQIENTFSMVVFSQFCASIVVICVSILQLSFIEPFTFQFFAMIIYTSTMLMEIFLYCYYGTILYEESLSVTDAICLGSWYNYDLKSKKALLTLMERSKEPMIVTAGKILDLSLNTFTMILRRAYSLLAVLKNY